MCKYIESTKSAYGLDMQRVQPSTWSLPHLQGRETGRAGSYPSSSSVEKRVSDCMPRRVDCRVPRRDSSVWTDDGNDRDVGIKSHRPADWAAMGVLANDEALLEVEVELCEAEENGARAEDPAEAEADAEADGLKDDDDAGDLNDRGDFEEADRKADRADDEADVNKAMAADRNGRAFATEGAAWAANGTGLERDAARDRRSDRMSSAMRSGVDATESLGGATFFVFQGCRFEPDAALIGPISAQNMGTATRVHGIGMSCARAVRHEDGRAAEQPRHDTADSPREHWPGGLLQALG
ncbi:uncharacterized protein BJ171DRAFT_505837 [Polychytrium aggregatum]|uniref:uncharacterized protein n=1 Tax=Polychytrium aggregatum TaxID=110093 RepID=UPI0022FEBCA8|nr:uncharacterized protein BJ171DRAFT_505837 [Polychytrium aggregatum]KAI9204439.1 hypothetical protein BJ171DRAFT_505837 [Polychytrium aggregatum]